jgi:putative endonuclease
MTVRGAFFASINLTKRYNIFMRQYYIYIMTNASKTLYIGVTNDLMRRVEEHKNGQIKGFTSKYHITKLVYFEQGDNIETAIAREKQIKGWLRNRKIALIESVNPDWRDLSEDWKDS